MQIKLSNVRINWPKLFVAEQFKGQGKFKYSATILIEKKHPQIEELNKVITKIAEDKWGAKAKAVLASIISDNPKNYCLKDGDKKGHEAYEHHFYINASNEKRPTVVDADTTPLQERDGRPYDGCYVVAYLDIWAQNNDFGKGINAGLCGIQFMRDGEPFTGGKASSLDEFENLAVDNEDADSLC